MTIVTSYLQWTRDFSIVRSDRGMAAVSGERRESAHGPGGAYPATVSLFDKAAM